MSLKESGNYTISKLSLKSLEKLDQRCISFTNGKVNFRFCKTETAEVKL